MEEKGENKTWKLRQLLTLGITQKGSLRQKLDQKWKSNGYWQALTGSNQGLIHLPLALLCSY